MSGRTILAVVLAVACGTFAVIGVNQLRQGNTAADDKVSVVAASADLPRGTVLEAKMLCTSPRLKDSLPKGTVASIDDAVGRTILVPLVQGEAILQSKLTDKDIGSGLAVLIPKGMRAFTIPTSHVAAGMAGLIRPGNKVDVLLTTTSSDRNDPSGGGVTTTLLQNVQVLAVAHRLDADDSAKPDPNEVKSVTLLVTPAQAAKLDLGMNKGLLHLTLRNPSDEREAEAPVATFAGLRFHQEQPFDLGGLTAALGKIADGVSRATAAQGVEPKRRSASRVSAIAAPSLPAGALATDGRTADGALSASPLYAEIPTFKGSSVGTVRIEVER